MNTFISTIITGTANGAIFALAALGLVIVWRGAGVVNFAQMGQAMFTTYIASNLINSGNSYWLAFIGRSGALCRHALRYGLRGSAMVWGNYANWWRCHDHRMAIGGAPICAPLSLVGIQERGHI